MEELEPLKRLDPVNRRYLEDYTRHLHMRGIRKETIRTKLWRVYVFLDNRSFLDARALQKTDVEDYIIERKKTVSPVTMEGEVLEVRLFVRWLTPEKEKALFPVKMKRTKKTLPVERLVTQENIKTLLDACTNQRDRALLMVLWDSACRISEILDRRVGDIQFDRYGATVIVTGKTGQRRLRLTDSVPDLQAWINVHPLRHDQDAPLFVTHRRYGSECRALDKCTVQNTLKIIGRRAGIQGVHPHALRHARLTDLAKQGFSEMELRIIAGWEKSSAMPEIYVHLSGADVEKKVLERAGVVKAEKEESQLSQKTCPRCGTRNAFDAIYCKICSLGLTPRAFEMLEILSAAKNEPDTLIEYANWLKARKSESLKKVIEG